MKKLDEALQTLSPGRQAVVLGRKPSLMSPSKTKAARQRLLFPTRAQWSDALSKEIKSAVKDFYLSDRISRTLLGKKDIKSVKLPNGKSECRQKQLLMYTTSDIHAQFNKEHPDMVIGRTKFRELRLEHVMPMTVNDQIVCACHQCENTQLLFDAVKSSSVIPVDTSNLHQRLKATACDLKNEQLLTTVQQLWFWRAVFSIWGRWSKTHHCFTVAAWWSDWRLHE